MDGAARADGAAGTPTMSGRLSRVVGRIRESAVRRLPTPRPPVIGMLVSMMLVASIGVWLAHRSGDVVVGTPDPSLSTPLAGPTILAAPPSTTTTVAPTTTTSRRVRAARSPAPPDGEPWPAPIPFSSSVKVPDRLQFILVVGSDARPGESVTRSRADSIHLVAVDPSTRAGTIVGIPRDTWTRIPGIGDGKISGALSLGGPDVLAAAVRTLTGLPVHYYVITGFHGFQAMVKAVGGVDVRVPHRMAEPFSGAYFQPGWHHFGGAEALAFSRNRKDVPNGDFSRSQNQGEVMLAALAKARSKIADMGGIRRWTGFLLDHVSLDMSVGELESLAVLARRIDPSALDNIVAPGRIGWAGRQSVVYLSPKAASIFKDLRDDAVIGTRTPPAPPPSSTTSSTTPPGGGGSGSTTTTTEPSGGGGGCGLLCL